MINMLELKFINEFIVKEKKDRLIYEFSNPQKRENAIMRFSHKVENIVNDKFIWMSIKNEQKEKIIFTYEDCNINTDNCVVLQQEFCVFSESGEWILPKKILDLYGCTTCVWIGCSAFAELMSKQEYQNICNDISANDFFEVLC